MAFVRADDKTFVSEPSTSLPFVKSLVTMLPCFIPFVRMTALALRHSRQAEALDRIEVIM